MLLLIQILVGIIYGTMGALLEQYNLIIQPVWWSMYGFIWGMTATFAWRIKC